MAVKHPPLGDLQQTALDHDTEILYSGHRTLRDLKTSIGLTLDMTALRELDIADEHGHVQEDGRQAQCTIFDNGIVLIDLQLNQNQN